MVQVLTDKNFNQGSGITLLLNSQQVAPNEYDVSSAIFVGDLTADGKTEIASIEWFTGNVTILYGNSSLYGEVTFTSNNSQYFCCYSDAFGVQDVTGDQVDDLLFEGAGGGTVYLLPGNKGKLDHSNMYYLGEYTSLYHPVISIGDVVGDSSMDLWWPYSESNLPYEINMYLVIPGGAYLLDNFGITPENVLKVGGWVITSELYLTPYRVGNLGYGIKDNLFISGYKAYNLSPNTTSSFHIIVGGQNLTSPIKLEDLNYEYLLSTTQILPNPNLGLRAFIVSALDNYATTFKGFGISFFNYTVIDPTWTEYTSNYCIIDGRNLSLYFKPNINDFINCTFGYSIECSTCEFQNIGHFSNTTTVSIFERSDSIGIPAVGLPLATILNNLNVPWVLENSGFILNNDSLFPEPYAQIGDFNGDNLTDLILALYSGDQRTHQIYLGGKDIFTNDSNSVCTDYFGQWYLCPPNPSPSPNPNYNPSSVNIGVIVGGVIGGVLGVALIAGLATWYYKNHVHGEHNNYAEMA